MEGPLLKLLIPIWASGFRGDDLNKLANQKQELPVAAMFVNGLGRYGQSL
jgi:hypothetical protein